MSHLGYKHLILIVPQPTGDLPAWARALTQFLTLKMDQLDRQNDLILSGTGSPEGAVEATVGSLFLRLDGGANTTLYVKESGTGRTGWVAK